jgi:hypothetical protein
MRPRRPRTATTRTLIAAAVVAVVISGCGTRHYNQVSCTPSRQAIFLLEAQAIPSATLIPCILPFRGAGATAAPRSDPGWSGSGSTPIERAPTQRRSG